MQMSKNVNNDVMICPLTYCEKNAVCFFHCSRSDQTDLRSDPILTVLVHFLLWFPLKVVAKINAYKMVLLAATLIGC